MNMFMYIMPPMIFLSTAWIPSGVQWFFVCLTGTTIVQNSITFNPSFRRWAELPPLPSKAGLNAASVLKAGSSYQPPSERPADRPSPGMAGNFTKGVKESFGRTEDQLEWERAQEYEKRRAAEDKEKRWIHATNPKRRRT